MIRMNRGFEAMLTKPRKLFKKEPKYIINREIRLSIFKWTIELSFKLKPKG